MSGIPQGSVWRLVLFGALVSNVDSGIECTMSGFGGDTKLSGAVHMLKRRGAIQMDLDRLEKLASANSKWFSKVNCKVLHLGRGNPQDKHRSLSALLSDPQQCCDQLRRTGCGAAGVGPKGAVGMLRVWSTSAKEPG